MELILLSLKSIPYLTGWMSVLQLPVSFLFDTTNSYMQVALPILLLAE